MTRPIVFVTDFGRDDTYAAALRGAVWGVDESIRCVDGTHAVAPGDVLAGAYHLKALARAFGSDAVLCSVVDPGVGSERRALVVDVDGLQCVAPDNGLISYLWAEALADRRRALRLEIPCEASSTFHGRDLFAPVAARLASGSALGTGAELVDDPMILSSAFAARDANLLHGVVAAVDRFGNAITTVRECDLGGARLWSVRWDGGGTHQFVSTYAQIDDGLAVLAGSAGHLEIAARGTSAAQLGAPRNGEAVTVELE
jgi:S-adenosylmethionine hydrolase